MVFHMPPALILVYYRLLDWNRNSTQSPGMMSRRYFVNSRFEPAVLGSEPLLPRPFPTSPASDPHEPVERKDPTRATAHLVPVLYRPLELWDRASDTLLGLHTWLKSGFTTSQRRRNGRMRQDHGTSNLRASSWPLSQARPALPTRALRMMGATSLELLFPSAIASAATTRLGARRCRQGSRAHALAGFFFSIGFVCAPSTNESSDSLLITTSSAFILLL